MFSVRSFTIAFVTISESMAQREGGDCGTNETRKKLLVLDINGLLVDSCFRAEKKDVNRPPDGKAHNFFIYERPFCKEFGQFCLDNFVVGIWSSARMHNVEALAQHVFGDAFNRLAFVWDQSWCTDTGLKHPRNKYKPIYLKELRKLWEKASESLPWEVGDYGPSNTLLLDDSPYKALQNPDHTGLFPDTWEAEQAEDNMLGPDGALRLYLIELELAPDIQRFIERYGFGQEALTGNVRDWLEECLKASEPAPLPAIHAPHGESGYDQRASQGREIPPAECRVSAAAVHRDSVWENDGNIVAGNHYRHPESDDRQYGKVASSLQTVKTAGQKRSDLESEPTLNRFHRRRAEPVTFEFQEPVEIRSIGRETEDVRGSEGGQHDGDNRWYRGSSRELREGSRTYVGREPGFERPFENVNCRNSEGNTYLPLPILPLPTLPLPTYLEHESHFSHRSIPSTVEEPEVWRRSRSGERERNSRPPHYKSVSGVERRMMDQGPSYANNNYVDEEDADGGWQRERRFTDKRRRVRSDDM